MVDESDPAQVPATLRQRIIQAAAGLLEESGLEAVSTRAVAARAGVPPPTIFRTFGDKDGLLEAVGEHGFRMYLDAKLRLASIEDPVEQLRAAWDLQVRFGLAHPGYYTLVYGQARSGYLPRAGRQAVDELRRMVTRVAAAGRLRMSVERAADVMHSVGVGTIITMISVPEESRDLVVFDIARELVIAALTTPPGDGPPAGKDEEDAALASSAMELRAALDRRGAPALSTAEQPLLVEWLNRLADTVPDRPAPVRGPGDAAVR
ncbi:TetR/AcrR family transcriptional regulator [Streptomyces sp. V4-01]|uniref:TetR/AcrR family transcriptional regulator n=1 Tax=Actinacidiphila polyblastidii TaxID=3110430 RepID=A0ABU7PBB2_9ACTN|nr:TetR/AcrR family transcriptional regulator [Streptomyces sp. V4-01]